MRPRRRKLSPEPFETRSQLWQSLGLGEQIRPDEEKRARGGLIFALILIGAVLIAYEHRDPLAPGYGTAPRVATVLALVIAGSGATRWLGRGVALRITATPQQSKDGSQLAEEVLGVLRMSTEWIGSANHS